MEVYSLPSRQSGICLRCRCYCQLSFHHSWNRQISQLKIIKNNTFSGAASLGGLHVARKCGAVCACEPRCGCIFATHKGRNNESLPLSWGITRCKYVIATWHGSNSLPPLSCLERHKFMKFILIYKTFSSVFHSLQFGQTTISCSWPGWWEWHNLVFM